MTLPNDIARCTGERCPSRHQCKRHTATLERRESDTLTPYADFWARREAGASACDSFLPLAQVEGAV